MALQMRLVSHIVVASKRIGEHTGSTRPSDEQRLAQNNAGDAAIQQSSFQQAPHTQRWDVRCVDCKVLSSNNLNQGSEEDGDNDGEQRLGHYSRNER